MIRAIIGLRRNPNVSPSQFRIRFEFDVLTILKQSIQLLNATSFGVFIAFQVEENAQFHRLWGGAPPFDVIVEFIWKDGATCREGMSRPEAQDLASKLAVMESSLVDSQQSTFTLIQD